MRFGHTSRAHIEVLQSLSVQRLLFFEQPRRRQVDACMKPEGPGGGTYHSQMLQQQCFAILEES